MFPSNTYGWMAVLFLLVLLPNLVVMFRSSDLSGDPMKQAAYLLFSCLILLVPAFVLKARAYFALLSVFLVLSPIEIGSVLVNRMPVSVGMMSAILNTNSQEAFELIYSLKGYAAAYLLLLVAFYWVLFVKIENKPLLTLRGKALLFGLFAIFNIALWLAMWKIAAFTDEPGYRVKTANMSFNTKYRKAYPFNLIAATSEVMLAQQEVRKMQERLKDFSFRAKPQEAIEEKELYVLVIGESARYGNFSLNGYHRPTSPLLEKQANLVSFDSVLATANLTTTAMRQLLTRATPQHPDRAYKENALPDAFRECGFSTAWLTNQSANDRFIRRITDKMDYTFFSTTDFDSADNYDGKLLSHLDSVLSLNNDKQLVVIHTLGSHFRYNARHPEDFRRFTPALSESTRYDVVGLANKELLVNSYDNSICYTDYVLHQIISRVERAKAVSAVVYISDHAENLYDDPTDMLMHGNTEPTFVELHIPLFVWTSDAYRAYRPDKADAIQTNKGKKASTTHLFHSFLDMAGIAYPGEDKESSIASPLFSADSVWHVLTPDERIIQKSIQ